MPRTNRKWNAFQPSINNQALEDRMLLSYVPPANAAPPIVIGTPASHVEPHTAPPVAVERG